MPGSPYGAPKRSGYHPDAPEGEFEWDLMPILAPAPTDYIVNTKRQATSSFLSTDLESLIRCLDVDTFFVIGINTNNCVLNFACDAANRCWTPILITDCVGSVHGEDLHAFALLNVSRTLGFAMSAADALRKLHAAQVGNTFSSSRSTREGAS
jgi:nicotinamidase-related amidase